MWGVRPQAEPPTHFTNLLQVRSTSVTDLNLKRIYHADNLYLADNRHFQWVFDVGYTLDSKYAVT